MKLVAIFFPSSAKKLEKDLYGKTQEEETLNCIFGYSI
jgi:hypothetical protein